MSLGTFRVGLRSIRSSSMVETNVVPLKAKDPTADADLSRLKRWFEEARDTTHEARELAERDRAYFDDFNQDQWTDTEKQTLRRRKQPVMTYNLVKVAINGMLGVVERTQTDPKALPRYEDKDNMADIATKALRFIADQNRLDRLKVKCARNFFVEGVCAVYIGVEQEKPDYKITLKRIPWEEFFADPFSKEEDYSDARYMGFARWADADTLKRRYKEKSDAIEVSLDGSGIVDKTYDDRPWSGWMDKKRRRLLLVEMYHQEDGQWMRCVFVAGAILEYGPSAYVDEQGRPCCAIEAQAYAKNRDNFAFGAVRSMISPQDGYNKRQSKLLHLLSTRQTFGSKMAVPDVAAVKAEMAKPDGHIEITAGTWNQDFGVIPTNDQVAGQFQLLQEDRAQLDRLLPNPGMLGREVGQKSGVALQNQQNAGMTELAEAFGGLTDFELRIYRQCWWRAKQFWRAQRWIRITDDAKAIEMLQVNVPVTDEMGMPVMDPQTGQPAMQNAIGQLDVDISIDAVPEAPTLQAEQFTMLTELAKMGMPIPPQAIIKASAVRNKSELLQDIDEAQKQQAQQPNPEMLKIQSAEKLGMGKLMLDKDKQSQDAQANAQKMQIDQANAATDAELKRIEAQVKMEELAIKREEMQLEREKMAHERLKMQAEMQMTGMQMRGEQESQAHEMRMQDAKEDQSEGEPIS